MAGVCIAERALDDTDIRVFLSVFFLPIRVGVDQSIQSGVDSRGLRNRRQISVRTYIYIYISCRGTRHVGYQNGQSDSFRNLFAIEIFKYMCVYICREIIYRAKSNVF